MRLTWTAVLLLAGLITPSVGTAQVTLDPEWMVQIRPAAHSSPQPDPPATASAELELLRLVAAEQEHHRRTGRFTGRLSELTSYARSAAVGIHVTAGPDWFVALAMTGDGAPMQATMWRKTAAVETAAPMQPEVRTSSGQRRYRTHGPSSFIGLDRRAPSRSAVHVAGTEPWG